MADTGTNPQGLRIEFNAASGIEYLTRLEDAYIGSGLTREETTLSLLAETRNMLDSNPDQIGLSMCKASLDHIRAMMTKELGMHRTIEEEKVRARTDSLTGIPNRKAFSEILPEAIERVGTPIVIQQASDPVEDEKRAPAGQDSKHYSALVFLDLDRFKGLNDTFGHKAGDACLQHFAELLTSITRDGDIITYTSDMHERARLGGDEFAIILNIVANSYEEAHEKSEMALTRIRKMLAVQGVEFEDKTLPVVSSSGMHLAEPGESVESVMKKADASLYAHKTELDENDAPLKPKRYKDSVEGLIALGKPNVQTVPDVRANEKTLEEIIEMGTALGELKQAGDVGIVVPRGSAAEPVKVLKEKGINMFFGTLAADGYPGLDVA